jgi:NAD(P)-dependent dehydrogenase (short-subunit alcohol dehydrogenase family)
LTFEGSYAPGSSDYAALLQQLGVARAAWGDVLPLTLMASSYLTGMEMPGERALYFQLDAELSNLAVHLPMAYRQELLSCDRRRGIVKSKFRLDNGSSLWAQGEMRALVLPPRARIAPPVGPIPAEVADRFAGKVAVVVGGSRGLGAHLALTLAAAGAKVIVLYFRSSDDAARLQAAASGLPGEVLAIQCDAAAPEACARVRQEILSRYGRLDFLVCSGVPALQNLFVEPEAYQRIDSFLSNGFAMVLAPLSSFADLLSSAGGAVLLISSAAVEDPPAVWPHYVALKCAVEGLGRTAAKQYPNVSFCIARPSKLATDLVNTPMGRTGAEDASLAALRILSAAAAQMSPGRVCYVGGTVDSSPGFAL